MDGETGVLNGTFTHNGIYLHFRRLRLYDDGLLRKHGYTYDGQPCPPGYNADVDTPQKGHCHDTFYDGTSRTPRVDTTTDGVTLIDAIEAKVLSQLFSI